jgi:hypothetical protein
MSQHVALMLSLGWIALKSAAAFIRQMIKRAA